MSATYDGKTIFPLVKDAHSYEIRGRFAFRPDVSPKPLLEICGRYIFEYMSASQPLYQIAKNGMVYAMTRKAAPLYEIR